MYENMESVAKGKYSIMDATKKQLYLLCACR